MVDLFSNNFSTLKINVAVRKIEFVLVLCLFFFFLAIVIGTVSFENVLMYSVNLGTL